MKQLKKPPKLERGNKVATVSLSRGLAGEPDILWRYQQGKRRLEQAFGLQVVEMPHTLCDAAYLDTHPQARAEDWMAAFADPSIRGIFSCIGGEDTIRLLPYLNFDTIRENPKVFLGYSDTTINHLMCFHAGLSSFYGAAVLSDFAENVELPDYTAHWIKRALFTGEKIGGIPPAPVWTSEFLDWSAENQNTRRHFFANEPYRVLQGTGKARGRLLGGCMETLEFAKGTVLFPKLAEFEGAILFLETSEQQPAANFVRRWMRNYGAMGVLERLNGLVFARPYGNRFAEDYHREIRRVLSEYGREDLPVLCNLSFGHCEPKCCIPYGALAEIDCGSAAFSILESGCA